MYSDLPDPDWYLDHVLLAAEPGGGSVGPARQTQATWQRLWLELSGASSSSRPNTGSRGPQRHIASPGSRPPTGSRALDAVRRMAANQGFVVTRGQGAACGLGDTDLRRMLRRREIISIRHGVLAPFDPAALDGSVRDRTDRAGTAPLVAAAAALVRPGTRVSHESAARAYGLPVLAIPTRPVLTHPHVRCAEGRADLLIHAAPCAADDCTDWFGAPITSVARTIVDVARCSGAGAGLVVADAALRERLVSRDELHGCVARASGWPGVRDARLVVELANPLAESPLESLTRLCLHRGGIRPSELQLPVHTAAGRFRVDLGWRGRRVAVECDGMIKYTAPYRLDGDGSNALVREKRRQESLERAGFVVVRVTWADVLREPEQTVARVRAALERGAAR